MAELVDAPDSKSGAFGRPGSTPGLGTLTKAAPSRLRR
jgi:hypothetical protein